MSVRSSDPQESHPWSNAVQSVAEAAATLVPLVAIIAGIGMMSALPPVNAAPIFSSAYEASEFFRLNQLSWDPRTPMVLSNENCAQCQNLGTELHEAGIPFVEQNISISPSSAKLLDLAKKVSNSQELPIVIVGNHVVTPRVRSIRMAIAKADRLEF